MRIASSFSRLRAISVACWICGSWLILQAAQISLTDPNLPLIIAIVIAAILMVAVGVAFWLLGTDTRAGAHLDTKGVALNLGHSASFVTWENIASAAVIRYRSELLALGSTEQIGIQLHNPEEYFQSYEERLPASSGPLSYALAVLYRNLRQGRKHSAISLHTLERSYRRTGYHLLIPETQLGGQATYFLRMIEAYSDHQRRHRMLSIMNEADY